MHNARQPQFPPVMDTDSKNSNNYYNKFESLATVCTGDAKRRRASGASPLNRPIFCACPPHPPAQRWGELCFSSCPPHPPAQRWGEQNTACALLSANQHVSIRPKSASELLSATQQAPHLCAGGCGGQAQKVKRPISVGRFTFCACETSHLCAGLCGGLA
jgi:hypothetical protein